MLREGLVGGGAGIYTSSFDVSTHTHFAGSSVAPPQLMLSIHISPDHKEERGCAVQTVIMLSLSSFDESTSISKV